MSGIKWSTVSQFGRQVLLLTTTIILAKTLLPSDFGLMSMAMVVVGFLNVFRDLGMSSAIIQRETISDRLLSSLFWVNVVFGSLMMTAVFLLAPFIADFYNETRLTLMLKALSALFLISSLGITHQALMERNLEFGKLAKAELISTLFGAGVGITLAIEGAGVWSLVFQTLSAVLVSTIMLSFFLHKWRPKFSFDLGEMRTVARFSLNLSGFNITNYFVRNADALLIGKFLGAQDLGYYSLAYRIMLYPLQNVTASVSRVMFPVYSKIRRENDKFRNAYLKVASTIAFITFPMMVGMMGVSDRFVMVFFGEKWRVVGLLLMIFSPVGLLQSIEATTGAIYLAHSRTDWMFRWGLATGVLGVIGFVVGLRWGIMGVAASCLIVALVSTYPGFRIPFGLIDLKVGDLARSVWRSLLCSVLMFFAVSATALLLSPGLSDKVALSILFLVGATSYALASQLFNRKSVSQVFRWLREFFV